MVALYTKVLAAVGMAGTVIGLGSLWVISAQLTEMKGSSAQTDKIIAADIDLAHAARDQAAAVTTNIELSQRAWIEPFNAKATAPELDKPMKVTVEYRNSGRQPGQMFQFVYQTRFTDADYLNIKKGFDYVTKSQDGCKQAIGIDVGQIVFPTLVVRDACFAGSSP